jgi:hypothetical protein
VPARSTNPLFFFSNNAAHPHFNIKICDVQFLDPNKGEKLESSTRRVASRDMIQFAPMKDAHGILVDQNLISFSFNTRNLKRC